MVFDSIWLNAFLSKYPGLYIFTSDDKEVLLRGELLLNHGFIPNGLNQKIYIKEKFVVEITLPRDYPNSLPTIKEIGGALNEEYPHINYDQTLCLAVEPKIRYELAPNYSLVDWLEKFVITFFYSYCFHSKYHRYPFGERSHGFLGILEYYADILETSNIEKVKMIIETVRYYEKSKLYKGHSLCPCGSNLKVRDCHTLDILNKIRFLDIELLKKYLWFLDNHEGG